MVALTFSDVLIVPKYSEIESRRDVDISASINKNLVLSLPIVAANMKSICGPKMAAEMAYHGGLGILHRFLTIDDAVKEFQESMCLLSERLSGNPDYKNKVGVSIGVQENDKKRFHELQKAGAKIFCLDVAHGHCKRVRDMLKWINGEIDRTFTIIAGNVATGEGAYDVADWGAHVIKVGLGPGHACTTRRATGVGVPQLHATRNVREEFIRQGINKDIICDGGIDVVGDICKALKYADLVMMGSFLSGTSETPGHVFRDEYGDFYKVYSGSASGENKNLSGNTVEFIEGISKKVPFRGHVKHILREISDGIRSACSYVGASNLAQFKEKCEFIEISDGGRTESKL